MTTLRTAYDELVRPAAAVRLRRLRFRMMTVEGVFSCIYRRNIWLGDESISGPGASLRQTEAIRTELPLLIDRLGTRTLLDAPCGDFNWMKETKLRLDQYIGADIVDELVQSNRRLHSSEHRSFVKKNLIRDPLPRVDLILCRDCLVHLSYADARSALRNFRSSNSTYLLATTFTERRSNADIVTGDWRPINLQAPPFDLPAPIALLDEQCSEGNGLYKDKGLGLWRTADIP